MTQTLTQQVLARKQFPFIDLKAQQALLRAKIDAAIEKVLDHGMYIMGPEVYELENKLAEFCGVKHAIACANGTDALILALMAKRLGPRDAVFLPSFTFAATAEAVALQGAQIIFVDSLDYTFNIDPVSLEQGIKTAISAGLKPVGIIPVDLFGQPADYAALQTIADEHKLWILADCAQSFGATYQGRKVGNIGDIATTSFFPAKPLGCYGDGGAVFTNCDETAEIIKSLRIHGQGADKYQNLRIGLNSRLDSIQAAVLLEKLKIFPDELSARQTIAQKYNSSLQEYAITPNVLSGVTSTWAQYTIRLTHGVDRTLLMTALKDLGIPTMIYYIHPLHTQATYKKYLTASRDKLPTCEQQAKDVLSLPMHPYISDADLKYFTDHLCNLLRVC